MTRWSYVDSTPWVSLRVISRDVVSPWVDVWAFLWDVTWVIKLGLVVL